MSETTHLDLWVDEYPRPLDIKPLPHTQDSRRIYLKPGTNEALHGEALEQRVKELETANAAVDDEIDNTTESGETVDDSTNESGETTDNNADESGEPVINGDSEVDDSL